LTTVDDRLFRWGPASIELGFTPNGQSVTMTVTWPIIWASTDGRRTVTANSNGTWQWPIRLPFSDSYPWRFLQDERARRMAIGKERTDG
jgi:hypothetical protein